MVFVGILAVWKRCLECRRNKDVPLHAAATLHRIGAAEGKAQRKGRHSGRIDASEGKMQKTRESTGSRIMEGTIFYKA